MHFWSEDKQLSNLYHFSHFKILGSVIWTHFHFPRSMRKIETIHFFGHFPSLPCLLPEKFVSFLFLNTFHLIFCPLKQYMNHLNIHWTPKYIYVIFLRKHVLKKMLGSREKKEVRLQQMTGNIGSLKVKEGKRVC